MVQDGSTPLHYAAAFGQSCVIETLVDAGCPVDATDDAQNTPLHLAAGEAKLALTTAHEHHCCMHAVIMSVRPAVRAGLTFLPLGGQVAGS